MLQFERKEYRYMAGTYLDRTTVKTLIIYDNSGKVWSTHGGVETVPEGVQGIIADAPLFYADIHLDMSTTPPTAIFVDGIDMEKIDAQTYYTAVMTDTLIEEE